LATPQSLRFCDKQLDV